MSADPRPVPSLRKLELKVEAEGREWMRRRLEEKLQVQADRHGGVFPRSARRAHHRHREPMHLRTAFGVVALAVWRGRNPADGRWVIPIRQQWGLTAHQQLSPALEEKLAYFATVTGSYEAAAKLAARVGFPVEDSTPPRAGATAGGAGRSADAGPARTTPGGENPCPCADGAGGADDGWVSSALSRAGLGKRKTVQPRVEWRESKLGVFYRYEASVRAEGGGNCWKRWWSVGREKAWNWAGGCTGKRCAAAWDERGACWRWPTGCRGSGTL